ncbi:MAG: hypothetical protein U1F65_01235 [Verrucomicrobiota bacterium]
MNRALPYLNLCGVVVLALLCGLQWRQNRRLNLDLNDALKTRLTQEQKLAESEQSLQGVNEDLARFKTQFTRTQEDLTAAREQQRSAERAQELATAERDQLKAGLTNWMHAVAERDTRLQEANDRITEVAGHLRESVQKFNLLVTNHNEVVARYNELVNKSSAEAGK